MSGPRTLPERAFRQRARLVAVLFCAVAAGLVGVLVILRPGMGVFSWAALLPLGAALLFALYSVLTRLTTRDERPSLPSSGPA